MARDSALGLYSVGGLAIVLLSISRIVFPPSPHLKPLASLFPKPRPRERTAIRLPTENPSPV